MDRDRAHFEAYWILAGATDRVTYHIGLNFEKNVGDILVIDEADLFIFSNAIRFIEAVGSHRCLCLTGTPDNCDEDGVERLILQALNFTMVDSVVENSAQLNELPHITELEDDTAEAFIGFLNEKLAVMPVILMTTEDRLA